MAVQVFAVWEGRSEFQGEYRCWGEARRAILRAEVLGVWPEGADAVGFHLDCAFIEGRAAMFVDRWEVLDEDAAYAVAGACGLLAS